MDTISQGLAEGEGSAGRPELAVKFRRPIPAIGGMREGFFVDNGIPKADAAFALQKAITFRGARRAYWNGSIRILAATTREYAHT
ncbi:hypothetical protein [Rhizobium mongolense]|uniref:Uncharacterized protein n=1 Tax=Rhizobium mongolense TaxID=57676 RepID=A0A7W6RJX3_9HYPH|nr:hypothetical protein [Rhizobium mongolense]MBB4273647.1 hypothetical protein [Rhizobium mongolense]